jgi:hypothetical protein
MTLNNLSDKDLIESAKKALEKSRQAEVDVLRHFREIEVRRLWIHVNSLYEYLSRTFNLTGDQVYPRLQAMRLMTDIPEIEEKLEIGALNITNVLKAHQVFRSEAKRREITSSEKHSVLAALENISTRSADKVLAEKYPTSHRLPEKIKPVSAGRNLLQFYVDDKSLSEIEKLKAKFSHQMPGGKMEDLIKLLIQMANRQPKPKDLKRAKAPSKTRSRYITADVRRKMENLRAQGCGHLDPSGNRCGSHYFLQRDHIHEFSRGGSSAIENLRWRCGFHNRNRGETESGTKISATLGVEIRTRSDSIEC